jgi:hypothetical protein
MNFPRPMLNSPVESGIAAGNAFYANLVRRVHESRERRIVLGEVLSQMLKPEMQDYYEQIVRQKIYCNCSSCRSRGWDAPSEKAGKDAACRSVTEQNSPDGNSLSGDFIL